MGKQLAKSHDDMVRHVAKHLKQRFYRDIRACIGGLPPPEGLPWPATGTGYVPDVTMLAKGHEFNVLEVETPDSLRERHTDDKWRALADHVGKRGGRFWVVVPRGARSVAEERLAALGLIGRVWEI